MLSDDICAVRGLASGGAEPTAVPGYPRLLLESDALGRLGLSTAPLLAGAPCDDKHKLRLEQFDADLAVPLRAIYALATDGGDQARIERIRGVDIVRELTQNTYRMGLLKDMQLIDRHLRHVDWIGRTVRMARLVRPERGCPLGELIRLVERDLGAVESPTAGALEP